MSVPSTSSTTLIPKPGEVGYTTYIPSKGQTSGIGVNPNPAAAAAAPVANPAWVFTPYVTKKGEAVFSKTTTIASGKNSGKSRTIFGVQKPDGAYKTMSMHEIKTGRKLAKKAKKDPCKPKKKRSISARFKAAKAKAGPKSEIAKARRKFNKRSQLKKKIDRSIQAEHVVTKSRDYKPNQNDFKGVDTKRR